MWKHDRMRFSPSSLSLIGSGESDSGTAQDGTERLMTSSKTLYEFVYPQEWTPVHAGRHRSTSDDVGDLD